MTTILDKNSIIKINGHDAPNEVEHYIFSKNGSSIIKIYCIASDENYLFNLETGKTFDITLPYCKTIQAILYKVISYAKDNEPARIELTFTYQNETINKAI